MTESGCQQCEENTYSGPGAEACTSCPDGKVSAAGSTLIDDCDFGECSFQYKSIQIKLFLPSINA